MAFFRSDEELDDMVDETWEILEWLPTPDQRETSTTQSGNVSSSAIATRSLEVADTLADHLAVITLTPSTTQEAAVSSSGQTESTTDGSHIFSKTEASSESAKDAADWKTERQMEQLPLDSSESEPKAGKGTKRRASESEHTADIYTDEPLSPTKEAILESHADGRVGNDIETRKDVIVPVAVMNRQGRQSVLTQTVQQCIPLDITDTSLSQNICSIRIAPSARLDSGVDSDGEAMKRNEHFNLGISSPDQATFTVSDRQRLLRLVMLGNRLSPATKETGPGPETSVVRKMISEGSGVEAVDILRGVSENGQEIRHDCLLGPLAACIRSNDKDTKSAAYAAVQTMCRTPTQLFQLVDCIKKSGATSGWGRGLRRAVCAWYNSYADNPMRLAMHVAKYRNRHGWTHRDLIRLSHIKPVNDTIGFIVRHCIMDWKDAESCFVQDDFLEQETLGQVCKYLRGVAEAKKCTDAERIVQLIKEHDLVREQLPTHILNEPSVWVALLPSMPLMALIRNINKMTSLGLFDTPEHVETVRSKLTNMAALKTARIHPFKLFMALRTYDSTASTGCYGHFFSERNPGFVPDQNIVNILGDAFYLSFGAVEPSNKRILVALDVSSSMERRLLNTNVSVLEAATVMALATVKTEPNCDVVGFCHELLPLHMFHDPDKDIKQLLTLVRKLNFGTTDCAKPMTWALSHRNEYDAFIIYTDCETNSHHIPPHVALHTYRQQMNIPTAKLIVVGMISNFISIARPDDLHMLDVTGFDTETPHQISAFLSGEVD